jgi:hypothetical protein
MSQFPSDDQNPYRPPVATEAIVPPQRPADMRLLKTLRDFRSQIVALGAFWIIIGGLCLGLGIALASGVVREREIDIVGIILAGIGAVWLGLGLLVCFKQLWALYVALVLSYLSLIGNVLNLNLCGIVLLIVVILQAHRVLGFAKELTSAGIPLTTKPKDLEIKLTLPM